MCTAALRVSVLACKSACCKRCSVRVIVIPYLVFSICIPTVSLLSPYKIHEYLVVSSNSMVHEVFGSSAILRRVD